MARSLVKLLKDVCEQIIDQWAKKLSEMKSSSYESSPMAELKAMCQRCFNGYLQMLDKADYSALRDFIKDKAKLRASMGSELTESQRALYTFKEVALPFIREEYGKDLARFDDALQRIDECLIGAIFDYAEAYQQEVRAMINEHLLEVEQFNRRLEHLSITDGLTGLYNHKYFQDVLSMEIKRVERYRRPLSLIIFDIDNFKDFNDTYGHSKGDEVIQKIAEILQDETRAIDIAARYGGEEFVMILPETDAKQARMVAEKVRRFVRGHSFSAGEGKKVYISLSAGVAEVKEYPVDKATLIEQADKAMYQAKRMGRDRVLAFADIIAE